jgi:hypothetical protein
MSDDKLWYQDAVVSSREGTASLPTTFDVDTRPGHSTFFDFIARSLMNGGCMTHPAYRRNSSRARSMVSWKSNRAESFAGSRNNGTVFVKKKIERPLTKLADAAFRQAARKVVERAIETGTSVVVWENGEIKQVDPRAIRIGRRKKNRD